MSHTEARPQSRIGNVLSNDSWSRSGEATEEESTLLNHRSQEMPRETQDRPFQGPCSTSSYLEDKMRRRLRFFFMNPIEKWQAKRRFPYKFLVQVIKIILVTVQLCLFAHNNYMHVNYAWDNRISFSHLFLRGWDISQEVPAYPPSTGPLALYKQDEFYETIDYALQGYYSLNNAIGSYSYTTENNSIGRVELCLYNYEEGQIFWNNESFVFNSNINQVCQNITKEEKGLLTSKSFLEEKKIEVNFNTLVKAELKFTVKTINFRAAGPLTSPDCYKFRIKIIMNNEDMDGQMLLSLDSEPVRLYCHGDTLYSDDDQIQSFVRTLLNLLVIFICAISLALCSRAIYRAQLLKFETMAFFDKMYGQPLSFDGRLEFLNMWYVMIIVNDLLIIMGSAIKQQIETKQYGGDHWNICSIFLGTGNLLVWFGVLRYLGFFKTYNVVILTLKKAAPKVIRFLICAILIYAGFTFCGWLVLGPYHMKFRSLATTSECLFALINGDDMFATFTITSFKSPLLWWYTRIYLYTFISLYIYVVLSLFISIIMDAYDTIKIYYRDGFPKNDLQSFVSVCTDTASSGVFRADDEEDQFFSDLFAKLCCCFKRKERNFNPLIPSSISSARSSDETVESNQVRPGVTRTYNT
ncbi:mucolipin-3-like [Trichogramma pretiosum]|uniref:mucolipin-3-like n=1 Tax=Trichogramma pretiosum TaxID=7493 RepID=UPI0006C9AFB0|nr:mucolipin-3-like [Trichogramma pretiosum]